MLLGGPTQTKDLIAGLELAGSGDRYIMNHIKRSLPASGFARVHDRSRVNRFFGELPQLEELAEDERQKLRCIFGEKVTFELATWLTDETPQFCITLTDPVTTFLGRHETVLSQAKAPDIQDLIDADVTDNPVSRMIAGQLGDLDFQDGKPDLEAVLHILKRVKFVFLSDHMGVQAAALFNTLGIALRGEDPPEAADWSAYDISDAQIETLLERHDVDASLFETVMMAHASQEGRSPNPLGFDEDLLAHDVGVLDKAMPDIETLLNRAYRDLLNEIQLEEQTESLLVLLEHGSLNFLTEPDLFFDLIRDTDFQFPRSPDKLANSKFNAGIFALRNLQLPKVAKQYAEAALDLNPDYGPARRLFARAKAAA